MAEETEGLQLGVVPAGQLLHRIKHNGFIHLVVGGYIVQPVLVAHTSARAAVGGDEAAGSGLHLSGGGGGEVEDVLQQLQVLLSEGAVAGGHSGPGSSP